MVRARNIPASKSSGVQKINVQSIAVLSSRSGTSSAETSNSNSSGTLAHIPLPANVEVVQGGFKMPEMHSSSQDLPNMNGDFGLENVSPVHLNSSWNVSPMQCNDDDDFQEPRIPKRKVAPRKPKGEGGSKRQRSQVPKHNLACKNSKVPCYGLCDSYLKKLLTPPKSIPVAPAPQQQSSDNDSGQSASQVLEIFHTDYDPITATSLLSPLPLSGSSLHAFHAEPCEQAPAFYAEPVQQAPVVECQPAKLVSEVGPVQQDVELPALCAAGIIEFDSLLERKRRLADGVASSTAKSSQLEAKLVEAERLVSELKEQLIAENSARSIQQSEIDGVSQEIDRWRSAWAPRMTM